MKKIWKTIGVSNVTCAWLLFNANFHITVHCWFRFKASVRH